MSLRSMSAVAVLAASAWCAAPVAWAQDATIHQVYQAAEAGKFIEAQAMMDKVLRDHPNSGKAHYIEAELLAKQGKFAQAGTELATAERLAPGLPFAKPEAVQQLRTLAARAHKAPAARVADAPAAAYAPDVAAAPAAPAPAGGGTPWGMILGIGAVIALAFAWFRNKSASRAAQQQHYPQTAGPAGTPGMGGAYPQQYGNPGNPPYGPGGMGAPGGGIGSGIMGGLATGAALGAGMVAGQALAHRFTDGDRTGHDAAGGNHLASGADPLSTPDPLFDTPPANDDMGGSDFGVSDNGSWDDGGGGGGGDDEWN
jgi:hypothetical protein